VGVACAHPMFGEALFTASRHVRSGSGQIFSEFVATFGLVAVIRSCVRFRPADVPGFIAAQLAGAIAAAALFAWLLRSQPEVKMEQVK